MSEIQCIGQAIDSHLRNVYYEDNDVYRMCIQVMQSVKLRILNTRAKNMETVLTLASDYEDQNI